MTVLTITFKDTLLRFRDRNALLLMLAAPLLIGLIMGAAFGGQNNGAAPVYAIPVAVVQADQGDLGAAFLDILAGIQVETASGPQPLFSLTALDDPQEARSLVERGQARGALILPAGFSAALQDPQAPAARLDLYTDPTYSVSPVILQGVVRRIALGFSSAALGGRLATANALAAVQADPALQDALANLPQALAAAQADFAARDAALSRIRITQETVGAAQEFDIMGYFMPSMAIFFLMFAVFSGVRSILEEEKQGTLPRLMTAPVSRAAILLGKLGGTLLTGLLQMAVLVLVSALLFGVNWGAPLGVALMSLSTIIAAAGMGALLAAFSRDDNQAGILGTAVALVFAVLGGNFVPLQNAPRWMNLLSKVTINRWALDGFVSLALDRLPVSAILPNAAILLGMGTLFFLLALPGFKRRLVR